ncbi:MAG TPA: hypothetical protein VLV83_08610 [Acidobacteriota bacterium]|nr:hypothetical protein [Acidobacteriota bacterium]
MSTTVDLPPDLLESVDDRARELGLSRNRYIIDALKLALERETQWSPRFVQELEAAREDKEGGQTLRELAEAIAARRTRKDPPAL